MTALAEIEVDAVVEIGPDTALGPAMLDAWPRAAGRGTPVVVTSLRRSAAEGAETAVDDAGFAAAVAQAYEAGFPLRFEGLFAGEARRRISLPGNPRRGRTSCAAVLTGWVPSAAASARAVARDAWRKPPPTSSSMCCPSNPSVSGCCRSPTRYGSCSRHAPQCSPKS